MNKLLKFVGLTEVYGGDLFNYMNKLSATTKVPFESKIQPQKLTIWQTFVVKSKLNRDFIENDFFLFFYVIIFVIIFETILRNKLSNFLISEDSKILTILLALLTQFRISYCISSGSVFLVFVLPIFHALELFESAFDVFSIIFVYFISLVLVFNAYVDGLIFDLELNNEIFKTMQQSIAPLNQKMDRRMYLMFLIEQMMFVKNW